MGAARFDPAMRLRLGGGGVDEFSGLWETPIRNQYDPRRIFLAAFVLSKHPSFGGTLMAEQAQAATNGGPRPIVPFLKLDPKPHLVGIKCSACGAIFLDAKRVACSKCGATGKFGPIDLSQKGKVYVFSVVHQSFPGIKTPYVT